MAKEQKHTLHSPLSALVKHHVLVQEPLIPQAVPHNPSRFSLKRIAFTLRRQLTDIRAGLSRTPRGCDDDR